MSLFNDIVKVALTPAAVIGKQVLKVVKPSSPTVNKPVSQITSELAGTTFGKVLGTATAATGAALIGTSGIVSKVLPTTKSKIVAGLVTPAAVSFIASKPQAVVSIPKETLGFSSAIGGLLADPSFTGVKQIVEEYPVGSAVLGAAGLITVGKGTAGLVASALNTAAIRQNTASQGIAPLGAAPIETPSVQQDSTLQTDTSQIKTAETTSLSTKKRSRKAKVKRIDGIRQSVRVNVINTRIGTTTKRYLNVIPLQNA